MTSPGAEPLRFSVVISSWRRPLWLKRCLLGVSQLDYPMFEVVLVADTPSLDQIDASHLKTVPFDTANISMARNAGIAASSGDICAFIDDDAVPEPTWLSHLADAFRQTDAAAVVGHVRGRNGISFQSKVTSIDKEAETHLEKDIGRHPVVPKLATGRAPKLVGTNMAVRREVLQKLGGFDPLYRYFLEDADLSIRIYDAKMNIGVSSAAEVHHSFASSDRRTPRRMPTNLEDIGRSTAVFLRRHYAGPMDEIYDRVQRRERARLLRHMVLGTCEPRDIRTILRTLEKGWRDGLEISLDEPVLGSNERDFKRLTSRYSGHRVVTSKLFLNRQNALTKAEEIVRSGSRVSLFSFSLTPVRHHVKFTRGGVWQQTGGLFGRANRSDPVFRWCRFARRFKKESDRVAIPRGFSDF